MTACVPKRNRPSWGSALNNQLVAYVFAVAAGVVSSGAIGTLWALATDEEPSLDALEHAGVLTAFRAIAFVLCTPTTLIVKSSYEFFNQPLFALVLLLTGLGLSFVQGVVLLTQLFGVT